MNDTYFNTVQYNTPAWRNLVICQEIAHTFGLDHQDENFSNANLGTCMDYTSDPDGTIKGQLSNEHPNAHDYEELGIIYSHNDPYSTFLSFFSSVTGKMRAPLTTPNVNVEDIDLDNPQEWGQAIRTDAKKKTSLFSRDFGRGEKVFTFVVWTDQSDRTHE